MNDYSDNYEEWANSELRSVRDYVASCVYCPIHLLEKLSNDKSSWVRYSVR